MPAPTETAGPRLGPSIPSLISVYRSDDVTPAQVCARILSEIDQRGADGVWISVASLPDVLTRCQELDKSANAHELPLYGIPFAVKDSLDVAGWETTLACPGYAYVAEETAPAVQRLLDAGAILIGKTNLDQFATGLNGTRTPYPIPRSVYGRGLISGGSSSGSALAVALGDVPFAVATDTAGSGRVPPALNGILGFKPSRGLISAVGLVPACRSLDCVSLMAGRVDDLATVFDQMAAPDRRDPWSRGRVHRHVDLAEVRVGLPGFGDLEFFGDEAMTSAHRAARSQVAHRFRTRSVSLEPFLAAGELLYQGPWVAERLAEFGDFLDAKPDAVLPVIGEIIRGGARFSAVDVFCAQYRLAELKAVVAEVFTTIDVLVLPTIGTTFTVEDVLAAPIESNTTLGHYTHLRQSAGSLCRRRAGRSHQRRPTGELHGAGPGPVRRTSSCASPPPLRPPRSKEDTDERSPAGSGPHCRRRPGPVPAAAGPGRADGDRHAARLPAAGWFRRDARQ